MNNTARIAIVVALLVVVGATLAIKQKNKASATGEISATAQKTELPTATPTPKIDQSTTFNSDQPATRPAVSDSSQPAPALPAKESNPDAPAAAPAIKAAVPRLIDLGANKCIPCKKMAPILEQLKKDYAGRMDVQFIDVWQNEKAGEAYGVRMIPTQIFFDAAGVERFRHEGFFSREDILAKWKELGIDVETQPTAKQ